MANTYRFGLKEIGPTKPSAHQKFSVYGSSTPIYRGDIVELVANGGVGRSAAGNEDNVGVAVAFYDPNGVPALYYPGDGSSGYTCIVNTDPMQLYAVHYHHASTALSAADVGTNADIVVSNGSSTTGQSASYITSVGTSAANLQILGLLEQTGNAWGTDCDVVVRLHEHIFTPAAAGI